MSSTFVQYITRRRAIAVLLLPLLALAVLFFTDPDKGVSTGIWLVRVVTAFVAGALAHFSLKLEHDYPEADRKSLFGIIRDASPDNPGRAIGAGLALIAQAIVFLAFVMLFAGQVRADEIPPRAHQYLPLLQAEQRSQWPDHPMPQVLAALVDHETACPRPSSCWSPTARLKSAREEGASFFQITRTWRADGSQRFDALKELKERHPALAEWSWENVYRRPDLAMRAFLMKSRDDFNYFVAVSDRAQRMIFALVSNNRGPGGVQSERRACAIVVGCDAGTWFANVELHCTASRAALYGTRSACDISRNYPRDILARAAKYRGLV